MMGSDSCQSGPSHHPVADCRLSGLSSEWSVPSSSRGKGQPGWALRSNVRTSGVGTYGSSSQHSARASSSRGQAQSGASHHSVRDKGQPRRALMAQRVQERLNRANMQ